VGGGVPGVEVLGIDRGDAIGVRIQLRFHGNGPRDAWVKAHTFARAADVHIVTRTLG
jgi:hypothetical protein